MTKKVSAVYDNEVIYSSITATGYQEEQSNGIHCLQFSLSKYFTLSSSYPNCVSKPAGKYVVGFCNLNNSSLDTLDTHFSYVEVTISKSPLL
mmetsp:Transcript_13448/g.19586  ORF Transcript_13448/g.19586 Transcript_13448/m.19586 type:complete len:92 (+) Transcript_13448:71-346(+)